LRLDPDAGQFRIAEAAEGGTGAFQKAANRFGGGYGGGDDGFGSAVSPPTTPDWLIA
jgi:hypothetical protein